MSIQGASPRRALTEATAQEAMSQGQSPDVSVRGAAAPSGGLVAQCFEGRPAGIAVLLLVRVRLVVQVLSADAAETGALGHAEDLLRQRERDRVPRPGGEVEHVPVHVLRPHLVVLRRLVLV